MVIGNVDLRQKVMVVAELSANHGGKLETALRTIDAAADAGADAIKLQTYTADTITLNAPTPYFKIETGSQWDGRTYHDLYQEAHTPWEWHPALFEAARNRGMEVFSSPFDFTAVDFLEELGAPAYKIASFEIQDIPLIKYAAVKGKPMILSTGIASNTDIARAIEACRSMGNNQILLLKCTSSYPAPLHTANLLTIPDYQERFQVMVGLSDHTEGFMAPVVATALGSRFVEKHFIIDRSVGGPDASFSMEPREFAEMVQRVRQAEESLGKVITDVPQELQKNRLFGRSLFASAPIRKGERLTAENIRSVRPGNGLHPMYYFDLLEKGVAVRDIPFGEPLTWDAIEGVQP
jgi:pseudaminic acid synthase